MTTEDALVGRVVDDRYKVLAPVGEGGMGLVFRAEHLKLNRPVALKVLQQEFVADSDLRERFEREARALAALGHPNIVTITDYGVMDQTPYLVMELLEGETLHHRLRSGALPPERACSIARQMVRALAHAHQQGIVHRDLKPGNIFLVPLPDDTDHVKILDFGLVRFLDGAKRPEDKLLTQAGSMLGTPAYMAPEQVAGEPTDARTDVYAAAVVIFEMLAGRKPFVGDPTDILRHHLLTPPPELSEVNPALEGEKAMSDLLARALSKEKRLRFADGAELLSALEDVPVPTSRAGAAQPDAPSELATMPTMHAGAAPAASPAAPIPAPTAMTVQSAPVAVPAAGVSEPSSTFHLQKGSLGRLKQLALAVGGGLAIAGLIVGLLLVAASGGEAPVDETSAPETASPSDSEAPAPAAAPATAAPAPPGAPEQPPQEAAAAVAEPPSEASPPAAEARPPAAEARPPAVNPWAAGVPGALRTAKSVLDSGRKLSTRSDRNLIRYAQHHRDDPRPHILLARAYLSRGWRSDAVERFLLALEKDIGARGDPNMLRDLVSLSTLEDQASNQAARAIRRAYGAEALSELDRQIAATQDSARSRLIRLKQQIEGENAR